jgi:hypothetical protein
MPAIGTRSPSHAFNSQSASARSAQKKQPDSDPVFDTLAAGERPPACSAVKFIGELADNVLDGPIRLVHRVEPVGACDRIEVKWYPVSGSTFNRRRFDRTVLCFSSMEPPLSVPEIDSRSGLAAHEERGRPPLNLAEQRSEFVDSGDWHFPDAEERSVAVRLDDQSCRARRQGNALGGKRSLGG